MNLNNRQGKSIKNKVLNPKILMHNLIKILVVEDEMIIGAKISMDLVALG
ncbi:MAG: hypothetical protein ABI358_08355 [Ginsengibacter sp.]